MINNNSNSVNKPVYLLNRFCFICLLPSSVLIVYFCREFLTWFLTLESVGSVKLKKNTVFLFDNHKH